MAAIRQYITFFVGSCFFQNFGRQPLIVFGIHRCERRCSVELIHFWLPNGVVQVKDDQSHRRTISTGGSCRRHSGCFPGCSSYLFCHGRVHKQGYEYAESTLLLRLDYSTLQRSQLCDRRVKIPAQDSYDWCPCRHGHRPTINQHATSTKNTIVLKIHYCEGIGLLHAWVGDQKQSNPRPQLGLSSTLTT